MTDIIKKVTRIREEAARAIEKAKNPDELDKIRVKYLGRKGTLTGLLRSVSGMGLEERRDAGKYANEVKREIISHLTERNSKLAGERYQTIQDNDQLDVTAPGVSSPSGRLHPLTQVMMEMIDIFEHLGFSVFLSPEIESDFYNFQALNIPKGHPARDTQGTFFLAADEETLLRTHNSPGQIRAMERLRPPIRVILPGKVFRRDDDPTHSPVFHQVEGLLVDETTNFSELKGTLAAFIREFFGPKRKVRFRPHHFPFTEPSAEMDVSCGVCKMTGKVSGRSCQACKGSGWLEIMGAGMVHPLVLEAGGLDPKRFRGFAFGIGVERSAMLKWNIPHIDHFWTNDVRFLEQF